MNNKINIINGPNLNLLGEREQSQYGSTTFEELKEICLNKSRELGLVADFSQSNIEGEIVSLIQDSRKNFDGIIINAAAFTHTSVAIRDALSIFKKPIIELHISNIYKREEFKLTELEYTEKDTKIKVSKNNISVNNQNFSSPKTDSHNLNTNLPEKSKTGIEVKSPIIGTAYHAPEPGAKKFVEVGKKIKKGDTVMIVEAMKTMNHVPSTANGVVKEICVEDGQAVEFGQNLLILD